MESVSGSERCHLGLLEPVRWWTGAPGYPSDLFHASREVGNQEWILSTVGAGILLTLRSHPQRWDYAVASGGLDLTYFAGSAVLCGAFRLDIMGVVSARRGCDRFEHSRSRNRGHLRPSNEAEAVQEAERSVWSR